VALTSSFPVEVLMKSASHHGHKTCLADLPQGIGSPVARMDFICSFAAGLLSVISS
jgi:hypothetical protein